jgi:hypothetical protein
VVVFVAVEYSTMNCGKDLRADLDRACCVVEQLMLWAGEARTAAAVSHQLLRHRVVTRVYLDRLLRQREKVIVRRGS